MTLGVIANSTVLRFYDRHVRSRHDKGTLKGKNSASFFCHTCIQSELAKLFDAIFCHLSVRITSNNSGITKMNISGRCLCASLLETCPRECFATLAHCLQVSDMVHTNADWASKECIDLLIRGRHGLLDRGTLSNGRQDMLLKALQIDYPTWHLILHCQTPAEEDHQEIYS